MAVIGRLGRSFAMGFAVFMELLNLRARKVAVAPVRLREGYVDAADRSRQPG